MAKKNQKNGAPTDFTKEEVAKIEAGVYIFKSISAMRLNIRPSQTDFTKTGFNQPKKVVTQGPIFIEFPKETRRFVLNEAVAAEHRLTLEEMFDLITAQSGYGRTFVAVSGPGIVMTDEVRNFEKRADSTIPKGIEVKAGIRDMESAGGR